MTLVMIVFAGGVICADEFTYTVASKTSVTSTDAPSGVTATFNNTYTTKDQLTKGNSMTLTIKGLSGKITALKLNLKRSTSSSAAGTLNVYAGTENIFKKTLANSDLQKSNYREDKFSFNSDIQSDNDLKIVLAATGNSIYCNSFTIVYTPTSTDPSKTPTSLSFGEEYDGKTITKYIGDENIYSIPATLTPSIEGASITYKSSNSELVYVDDKGDMKICGTEPGSATITAEYAGDDTYASSSVSYTVQVKKPVIVEDGVFDFTSGELDYGSGLKPKNNYGSTEYDSDITWIAKNVTIKTPNKIRWFINKDGENELRMYSGSTFTVSVPDNSHITNVAITGAYSFKADCGTYNSNSGKWNGDAKTITFSYNAKSGAIAVKTITVTYVPDVTLTTAASSFATYAADYAVDYSAAGLDAYAVTLDESKGTVAYNAIEGTTPAGTAVLVKGNASTTYSLAPSTDKEATVTTALQISDGNVTAADNLYYGFTTLNGVSGFKLVQNGVTIPAKKGYLKLSSADNAKTFYAFDGNTTGIEETFSKNEAEKALAPMYNISGQRVGEGYKGIVIVNGKKYVK